MGVLSTNKVGGWRRGSMGKQTLRVERRIKAKAQGCVDVIFARTVGLARRYILNIRPRDLDFVCRA